MGDGILIIISINISMQHNDRIKFYRERELYCSRICKRSPVSGGDFGIASGSRWITSVHR